MNNCGVGYTNSRDQGDPNSANLAWNLHENGCGTVSKLFSTAMPPGPQHPMQAELKQSMAARRGDMAHTAANEVLSNIDYDGVGGLGVPPEPVGLPRLTWRDPIGSDAEIVLGNTKYTVHRTVLCKEGKSDMFRRQLQSEGASFDLSTLLPKACWDVLPLLLDFLYDDFFNPGLI